VTIDGHWPLAVIRISRDPLCHPSATWSAGHPFTWHDPEKRMPPHPCSKTAGSDEFSGPKAIQPFLITCPCTATILQALLKWLGPFTRMFSEKPLVDGLLKSFAKFRNGCDEKVRYIATLWLSMIRSDNHRWDFSLTEVWLGLEKKKLPYNLVYKFVLSTLFVKQQGAIHSNSAKVTLRSN